MRTSRKTDFGKLKINLVSMTYHSQRPQCPSLSPHVLLVKDMALIGLAPICDAAPNFRNQEKLCCTVR